MGDLRFLFSIFLRLLSSVFRLSYHTFILLLFSSFFFLSSLFLVPRPRGASLFVKTKTKQDENEKTKQSRRQHLFQKNTCFKKNASQRQQLFQNFKIVSEDISKNKFRKKFRKTENEMPSTLRDSTIQKQKKTMRKRKRINHQK